MVRCCIDGCLVTARNPKAKCWIQFGMCFHHAIELHPEIYQYKLSKDRKSNRKRGVRGGNPVADSNSKPMVEFVIATPKNQSNV